MEALFDIIPEASPAQRLLLLWAFVAVGLVIAVQLSQTQSDDPFRWTILTSETRLFWLTIYVLEIFLLVQNTYPILLNKMESLFDIGNEERILNAVWVGLLGIEVLMVLGVAVRSIAKRLSPAPKTKTA